MTQDYFQLIIGNRLTNSVRIEKCKFSIAALDWTAPEEFDQCPPWRWTPGKEHTDKCPEPSCKAHCFWNIYGDNTTQTEKTLSVYSDLTIFSTTLKIPTHQTNLPIFSISLYVHKESKEHTRYFSGAVWKTWEKVLTGFFHKWSVDVGKWNKKKTVRDLGTWLGRTHGHLGSNNSWFCI